MDFVPAKYTPPGGYEAGEALEEHALHGAPAAAFVYLMTGDKQYAAYAWEVFELCGQVNRWGWFPWAGSHMPQIHFGMVSRDLVLIADCVWDNLSSEQRRRARAILAEKCVEPYFRIVLHTPGIGLYHLRSVNQGNNAQAAALIASLFIGDAIPENEVWFNSLLQTYHWTITHDIGWMGQGLESGIGGYWSVSMQNLYTAAAVLANVTGIDLRGHPAFEQATLYPVVHEVTVPAVDYFDKPIDPKSKALAMGIIAGKPLELPQDARCGPWWFDYARRFPAGAAQYFITRGMLDKERLVVLDAHQGALGEVLGLAWWDDSLFRPAAPPPHKSLFTDRMANLRSGYGFGETSLYFNGDIFLSARKEILGCTSGMSWHFPWHQYQVTESGIETEGELFAPSMLIKDAGDGGAAAYFRATAGPSNVRYYEQKGQRESHTHYLRRDRTIVHVRGGGRRQEYFLFLDRVAEKKPAWHAWTWHVWNSVDNPANYGRFTPEGENAVRVARPNADLWIRFLTPDRVTIEQHGIASQPAVSYVMDHNAQMMRAIAGPLAATTAKPVIIPPSAWKGLGEVQADALYLAQPPTEKAVTSDSASGLVGGVRYRCSLRCKKQDYRVYEATAWEVDLELLDAKGNVLARPDTPHGHPHPLRLAPPFPIIRSTTGARPCNISMLLPAQPLAGRCSGPSDLPMSSSSANFGSASSSFDLSACRSAQPSRHS